MTRSRRIRKPRIPLCVAVALGIGSAGAVAGGYPARDVLGYGLACMERHDSSPAALHRCACAIEHIERTLPYEDFHAARIFAALRDAGGERAMAFSRTRTVSATVAQYLEVQAEANRACFPRRATAPTTE